MKLPPAIHIHSEVVKLAMETREMKSSHDGTKWYHSTLDIITEDGVGMRLEISTTFPIEDFKIKK